MPRQKGARLPLLTDEDRQTWPIGASVWVPNGASGWFKGTVTGHTENFVTVRSDFRRHQSMPHKLRARVNEIAPTESAY